jgi:hypothetical protein
MVLFTIIVVFISSFHSRANIFVLTVEIFKLYCHDIMEYDCRRGLDCNWMYGTLTDRNYKVLYSHTLQFTTARTKASQSAVSSPVVAW